MSPGRRIALVVGASVALAIAAAVGLGTYLLWDRGPKPEVYVVVRGDTLFKIARAHDVTVDQLRAWNGIEGDLIEVGQRIEIFGEVAVPRLPASPARPQRKRASGSAVADVAPDRAPLVMPDPQDCLAGPELSGTADDIEMVASQGLTRSQISGAMNAFLPRIVPCIHDAGAQPTGTLMLDIRVGCNGLVADIAVLSADDWPAEVGSCVTETLRYAPFPAHDLPDGEQFTFPLSFTPG